MHHVLRRVRLARVLTRLNLGGPARQALGSDPLLMQRGVELRVYCGQASAGEGDLFDEFVRRGIDVRRVPGLGRALSGVGDLRAWRHLRRDLKEFQPDVLHTHASKAGLLGRIASRGLRARDGAALVRVHSFHGHVLEGYFGAHISRGLIAVERRLAAQTDRILAVSHATARDLLRLEIVGPERLVVVTPGVDLSELLAIEGPSGAIRGLIGAQTQDFVVGVLGRLAEVKCPERAVDVFQMLTARHPHLHLVFIGDGSERRALEGRVASLPAPASARVHMLGARADVGAVLADLDAVLLTSRSEGLPVALIEAGAVAKPAVAMNVGGVSEIIAHERTGFLGADVDELAYGLDRLISEPSLAASMGRRARVRAADKFSAEVLSQRLHAVYSALMEEQRCAS